MYQRLVVQFSNSLSQILLLASAGKFANGLQEELEKHGFNVRFITFDQLLQRDFTDKLTHQNFYKIITLSGWEKKPVDSQKIVQFLNRRYEPTLIISRLDSLPAFGQRAHAKLRQLQTSQLENINNFALSLPKATLLIGQDVVVPEVMPLSLSYICRQFLSHNRLTDPEINFGFTYFPHFISQILPTIFSPYTGEKFLFQAQSISSDKLLQRLSSFSNQPTTIISQPFISNQFDFSFSPLILSGSTDLQFLTQDFFKRYFVTQLEETWTIQKPQLTTSSDLVKKKSRFSQKILDQKTLVEFQSQIAAKEQQILANYQNTCSSPIYIHIPQCNLLEGKLVCKNISSPILKIPPLNQVVLSHQNYLFVPPVNPPFAVSRHLSRLQKPPSLVSNSSKPSLSVKTEPQKTTNTVTSQTLLSPAVKKPLQSQSASTSLVKKPTTAIKNTPADSRRLKVNRSIKKTSPRKIYLATPTKPSFFTPLNLIIVSSILLVLILVYIFVLPSTYLSQTETNFKNYFSSCQNRESCFTLENNDFFDQNLTNNQTSALIVDFHQQLKVFSYQKNLFSQQLTRLYRTILQLETGDVASELSLTDSRLAETLIALTTLNTSFNNAQTELSTFIPSGNLEQFQEQLNLYKNQLLLWQKYHELILALTQPEQVSLSLLLLDNTHLLSQGGQFLALKNFTLNSGRASNSAFIPVSQIADQDSLTFSNPQIIELAASATPAAGLYNAPYQEDFSSFATIASQASQVATSEADLLISFNLNSFSRLAASVTDQTATEIFEQIKTQIKNLDLESKEDFFLQLYNNLDQVLLSLNDQEKILNFIFTLLHEINQEEILFGSRQPSFSDLINLLRLDHQLDSRSCPSSLGGDVCYLDSFVQLRSLIIGEDLTLLKIEHTVTIDAQKTFHSRSLTFSNPYSTSSLETIFFQLPEQVTTANFIVNNKEQTVNTDGSFTILIPAHQTITAVLDYTIPRSISQNNFVYSFAEQKQSGAYNQETTVIFKNSLPYSPKIIAPNAIITGKKVTFGSYQDENFLGAVAF